MKKGIDVSVHQGVIDWEKVNPEIDFAIIRAGYGLGTVDKQFEYNSQMCERLNIPYGVYWFSYAYTVQQAQIEAESCLNLLRSKNPTYPIAFDWEYDSYDYSYRHGVKVEGELMCAMADSFLLKVKEAGYYPMLYTNPDFLNRGFNSLVSKYDVWLAHWTDRQPGYTVGIWQHSNSGSVSGIKGRVDLDISYKDYPAIISGSINEEIHPDDYSEKWKESAYQKYFNIAREVCLGNWGNGEERKNKMKAAGIDYELAQMLVNYML